MATLQAERIGDVEEGETTVPQGETDELGLTPEERATFDGMRDADAGLPEATESDEPAPAGETPPGVDRPPTGAPEVAQTTKKTEPEEDDEPDQVMRDPRTGKEQRTISYGKHQRLLKREREAAEALRQQQHQAEINQAKLNERLDMLNAALTAPMPQQPMTQQEAEYARQQAMLQNPLLEPTIDPAVDLGGAIAQVQRRQEYMVHASTQQQESTQEQLQDQALLRDFTRDSQLYSQTEEGQHFFGGDGAYQFLKNSRLVELGIALFDKDVMDRNEQFSQQEINKMISDFNAEEKWVVQNALQAGKSPAKAIMRLARGRGWRPPQAAPAALAPAPAAGTRSQQPRQTARAPAPVPSAVAQIQAEQAGAAASRSLSDGGGAPPAVALSPEEMLRMNDDEFAIYVDSLPKRTLDSIMGRDFNGR